MIPSADENNPADALGAVEQAEGDGKLAGLQSVLDDHGWPTDAGTLIMLAQNDDRTAGKSPDEVADMLRSDETLYDDLEATKPGGKLAKKHPDVETPKEDASEEPGDEEMESISGKMKNPMSEGDKKKAPGVLKKMGKKPEDLDTFEGMASFKRGMMGK